MIYVKVNDQNQKWDRPIPYLLHTIYLFTYRVVHRCRAFKIDESSKLKFVSLACNAASHSKNKRNAAMISLLLIQTQVRIVGKKGFK